MKLILFYRGICFILNYMPRKISYEFIFFSVKQYKRKLTVYDQMKHKFSCLQTVVSYTVVVAFILHFDLSYYQLSVKTPIRQTVLGIFDDQLVSPKPLNFWQWTARKLKQVRTKTETFEKFFSLSHSYSKISCTSAVIV